MKVSSKVGCRMMHKISVAGHHRVDNRRIRTLTQSALSWKPIRLCSPSRVHQPLFRSRKQAVWNLHGEAMELQPEAELWLAGSFHDDPILFQAYRSVRSSARAFPPDPRPSPSSLHEVESIA